MSDERNPEEENPFESPQRRSSVRDPESSRGTALRHVIVVVLSVLLIPPAVIIAFFFVCLATGSTFESLPVGIVGGLIAGIAVLAGLCYLANKLWNMS